MFKEEPLLRSEIGCPELLTSHELAHILLDLPDRFIKVIGNGQSILSVEECRLLYHEDSSKELGREINLITNQDIFNFMNGEVENEFPKD